MSKNFADYKKDFFTSLPEAVEIIKERRKDANLDLQVRNFLNNDIPTHFEQSKPVAYLSRHVATPNFEALRFMEMTKNFDVINVVGQDKKGKFASINPIKRCLGKMMVVKGINHNNEEMLEHFTVIDFSKYDGTTIGDIKTINNEDLTSFHNNLFKSLYGESVVIADESEWLDRHHRSDLLKEYEHMLALNISHSILFESFLPDEDEFFYEIFEPAFNTVTKALGVRPLVVETITDEQESSKNWDAYPTEIYETLKEKIKPVH